MGRRITITYINDYIDSLGISGHVNCPKIRPSDYFFDWRPLHGYNKLNISIWPTWRCPSVYIANGTPRRREPRQLMESTSLYSSKLDLITPWDAFWYAIYELRLAAWLVCLTTLNQLAACTMQRGLSRRNQGCSWSLLYIVIFDDIYIKLINSELD